MLEAIINITAGFAGGVIFTAVFLFLHNKIVEKKIAKITSAAQAVAATVKAA